MKLKQVNNIVLCCVDTLRRDHCGFYGYPHGTTPNLDKLAAKSVVFDNAYAVSNKTDPAFTTIMTGLSPQTHGITAHGGNVSEEAEQAVAQYPTIAQKLALEGFNTVALDFLGRWHRKGFMSYMGLCEDRAKKEGLIEDIRRRLNIQPGTLSYRVLSKTPIYKYLLGMLFKDEDPPYARADVLVDLALPLLTSVNNRGTECRVWSPEGTKQPVSATAERNIGQFTFLHFWDPHIPYWPPREFIKTTSHDPTPLVDIRKTFKAPLRRFFFDKMMHKCKTVGGAINAYDGEIRFVDHHIGRLIDSIDMDNTLFIFNADHGESLTEDGIYFTHDGDADCVMRVPLMVWYPGCKAERVSDKVDLTCIAPTIMNYCGIAMETEGRSLI